MQYISRYGSQPLARGLVLARNFTFPKNIVPSRVFSATRPGSFETASKRLSTAAAHPHSPSKSTGWRFLSRILPLSILGAGLGTYCFSDKLHGSDLAEGPPTKINDRPEQARWLQGLAKIAIQAADEGAFAEALKVAEIVGGSRKQGILEYIAKKAARASDFDCAQRVAHGLKTAPKNRILKCVSKRMAEAGLFDRALEIANTLHKCSKEKALGYVAGKMIEANLFDRALEIADTLDNAYLKIDILDGVARKRADIGEFDEALKIADMLELLEKASVQEYISKKLGDAEKFERAVGIINGMCEEFREYAAEEYLICIETAYAHVIKKALDTTEDFGRVMKIVDEISDKCSKAFVLYCVSIEMADRGDIDLARRTAAIITDEASYKQAIDYINKKTLYSC